jgi:hypothetical protein
VVALDVTKKCGIVEFVESATFCKIDEMNLILEDIFLETHMVDVRNKPMYL